VIEDGKVIFKIFAPRNTAMSKVVYAVYHGRFIEMLLRHFDEELDDVIATSLPAYGDRVNTRTQTKR